jgi:putative ABC transport system substrate-binding protein
MQEKMMWCSAVGCLVTLTLSLLAAPLAAQAQQPAGKVPRIGLLAPRSPSTFVTEIAAFRQGLHELGYREGENILIEYRWAEGRYDRLAELAAELVQHGVDVIVTSGTPRTRAAKEATRTIPIVMAISGDAMATRLIASLARPGGNVTGSSYLFPELNATRLERLKEIILGATRVAVLVNPANLSHRPALKVMERMAPSLGIELQYLQVRGPEELGHAFSAATTRHADAVMVLDDAMLFTERARIAELGAKSRLPTIFGDADGARVGGLFSYGPNFPHLWQRAAVYLDKILKGAKPADLPVEQPTKFELVINLKTAEALGITIPPTLLFLADEVIR